MDVQLVQLALAGDFPLEDLSIPERLALTQAEILRVVIIPAEPTLPLRFVLPPQLEQLFRGRSS